MSADAYLAIACPYCDAPARVAQTISPSTLGAITWTDGWMDAPMMPRAPRIARCPQCRKIYWLATATQLGLFSPGDPGEAAAILQTAPDLAALDEAGCHEALREGLAPTPDLELELRVFCWWRGNDAFREPDHAPGHSTALDAIANMERIIELTHDVWEEDLALFRAEALRHLGRFPEAREALDRVGCSDYWPAKSRQLALLDAASRDLGILFSPECPPHLPGAEEDPG